MLKEIKEAETDLLRLGIEAVALDTAAPASEGTLQEVEGRIKHRLPYALRQVFLHEAGEIKCRWNTDLFGPDSTRGFAWLLSPRGLEEAFKAQVEMAEEAKRDGLDATGDGYRALVTDWPRWVPIFRFPSGDCFCLEFSDSASDPPIVFLEHDVMDQGPNLHGLRLASNFGDLVARWSSVLFVDVHDWTKAVAADGIDKNAAVLRPLRRLSQAGPTG